MLYLWFRVISISSKHFGGDKSVADTHLELRCVGGKSQQQSWDTVSILYVSLHTGTTPEHENITKSIYNCTINSPKGP